MREKLTKLIRKADKEDHESQTQDVHYAFMADNLIANDVVPVVRCKDCEYGMYAGLGKFMCELHEFVGKAYFYCADGERRTDDETTG